MKVFLVIDETNFYQPNFINDLLQNSEFVFVGCALVVKVPRKNNIDRYLIRNMGYLFASEILILGFKKIKYWLFNKIGVHNKNNFYSVKTVLKFYNIPFFYVKDNINEREYLDKIKNYSPDVILSSNSLYFKDEILNIAKYCINRHSSLLPSYGGLWPVFQALRSNEKFVGVSVHLMTRGIDEGKVIAQEKIEVLISDTVDTLYQKCFQLSTIVCIRALKALLSNTVENIDTPDFSYYKFPTKKQWMEFRQNGKKFI